MARFLYAKIRELQRQDELRYSFAPRRLRANLLAESYYRIGQYDAAARVGTCGTMLGYGAVVDPATGELRKDRLREANFCRDRLCPMCAWRRSLKLYGQTRRIIEHAGSDFDYIMLTVTIRNVDGEQLPGAIDGILHGWAKMHKRRRVQRAVAGGFRSLEVTRNASNGSYHPHMHFVLAVGKSYWHKDYIKQSDWLQLWRDAYGDQYITQVDVRQIRPRAGRSSIEAAVAEVAKYAVKDRDYIMEWSEAQTDEAVGALSAALRGRRLVAYFGVLLDAQRALKLDDPIDGDLVHVTDDETEAPAPYIMYFAWVHPRYRIAKVRLNEEVCKDAVGS